MSERVILTENDKANPIMSKVHTYLEQRLSALRTENDGDADERTTAKRRGAIAEVKAMQALWKDRPNL